jgi:hypothetical protein
VTSDFEVPTPQSKETTSDAASHPERREAQRSVHARPFEERPVVEGAVSRQLLTLGERLVHQTQRFASSHVPVLPWLRLLNPVIKRASSLPVPSQARFQRTEVSRVPELARLVSQEPSSEEEGQPLSPYVQQRLRDFVGPGTEAIRVHTDKTANAIAHALKADAVTVGEQVFFRQGRFRPHEDEGFALLTHEATHVIQAMRPGSSWRRATQAGVQEEEQEASIQERNVLHARRKAAFLPQPTPHRAPVSQHPAGTSSSVHRPLAAPAERTLDNVTPPVPTMPDIEDLKRMLYRDLMRQIRADLERGG